MEIVDCVVVGAGVVGLAVARALAKSGLQTIIIERHAVLGAETSSRNSEVIHAGIHYEAGSLKARLCVRGRDLLYEYCRQRGVPYRQCGKLIVATDDSQIQALTGICSAALVNDVRDLLVLDRAEARSLEPALECVAAVLSPSTGIVDSHSLMLSLLGDAERNGAMIAYRTNARSVQILPGALEIQMSEPAGASVVARWLVNCAGLGAVQLVEKCVGYPGESHSPGVSCEG